MRKIALLVVALFMIALPKSGHAIGIEVAVGGWGQSPEGTAGYRPIPLVDQNFDLETDAKYDDEVRPFGRAKIDLPLVPNIYLMGTPMQFEGTGQKTTNFSFGGQTFQGGVDFYSKIVLDHYDIGLFYGIPLLETVTGDRLNAEVGINMRIIDFSAEVTQAATGFSEATSETIPLPMIYAAVHIRPFKWLSLELEGRGISYSDNSFFDYIGRVKLQPFSMPLRSLFIAGGFRYEDIEIDEKDIKAEMTFSGPFAEVGIDF